MKNFVPYGVPYSIGAFENVCLKVRFMNRPTYFNWQTSFDVYHIGVILWSYAYIEPRIFRTVAGSPGIFDMSRFDCSKARGGFV